MRDLSDLKDLINKIQEDIEKYQKGFSYRKEGSKRLYHATSSEMNYCRGFSFLFRLVKDICNPMHEIEESNLTCNETFEIFTDLLYKVIQYYPEEFNFLKGESMRYRIQFGDHPGFVIVLKDCDGLMHAFSFSEDCLLNLPHDSHDEWEVVDWRIVEES